MKKVESPNYSFVVQISDDNGNSLDCTRIDQYVDPRQGNRGLERCRNTMERHLFHQFRKTGKHHYVIFEGDPERAKQFLAIGDDIPF